MNAFLTVRVTRLPVNSLEEIDEKKMNLLLWSDDRLEQYLSQYDVHKNAKKEGRMEYLKSTGRFTDVRNFIS